MRTLPDQKGLIYNSLLILEDLGRLPVGNKGLTTRFVMVECIPCKTIKKVMLREIRCGKTKSCGCLKNERISQQNAKHGMTGTKLYQSYYNMVARCTNKNNPYYLHYGGRGIKVCDRWLESFDNFMEDMGGTYKDSLELDRINCNLGYCRENCIWVNETTQSYNRRSLVNTSGRIGVCFHKLTGKWQASISKEGKKYHLGIFETFEDAVKARETAELQYYGKTKGGNEWLV